MDNFCAETVATATATALDVLRGPELELNWVLLVAGAELTNKK